MPLCTNTTIKSPDKLFIFVPYDKTIRNKWLKLARRDIKGKKTWYIEKQKVYIIF